MTLIAPAINSYSCPNFIMENQLMDNYETSFLYEWQTAEEDLEFLDYTYCFEDNSNKRRLSGSKQTIALSSNDNNERNERQTILDISLAKLRAIEDPESCLCRSVLINNTLKCIQSASRVSLNEESSNCCACPLPTKRLRSDEMPNRFATTDILKDSFEDYQEAIISQESNSVEKEIGNHQIDKVFNSETSLCLSELDAAVNRHKTKDALRNCDKIRLSKLEFPKVIRALET